MSLGRTMLTCGTLYVVLCAVFTVLFLKADAIAAASLMAICGLAFPCLWIVQWIVHKKRMVKIGEKA